MSDITISKSDSCKLRDSVRSLLRMEEKMLKEEDRNPPRHYERGDDRSMEETMEGLAELALGLQELGKAIEDMKAKEGRLREIVAKYRETLTAKLGELETAFSGEDEEETSAAA